MYADLGVPDLSFVPRKMVPNAKTITDYEIKRVEPIEGTALGSSVTWVSPTMEATTRAIIHHRAGVSVNAEELEMAGQAGFDLLGTSLKPVIANILMQQAQIVFQGTTASRDKVSVNGMIDDGEDTNSGLDDDAWDTAASPFTHLKEGVKDLIANNYAPPYVWIMSYNLLPGYHSLHNAAGGLTEAMLAKGTGLDYPAYIEKVVFANNGTDASNVIYPLPAAANDDGVWIMCKASVENFYLGIIKPLGTLPWEYNRNNNSYDTIMETRYTFVIRDGTAIVYEPDVDLA
jgi:hypothetical protein